MKKEASKGRRNGKRWLIDAMILVLVLAGVTAWQGRNLLGTGEAAPGLVLQDLDGETHRLSDLRGKKVLLFFWAPWCGVCKAVAPNVRSMSRGGNVEVLSVALSYDDPAKVAAAAAEMDLQGTTLLGHSQVIQDFAVGAYPTFYVIDEDGTIRRSFLGYTTWLGLWSRTLW